MGKVDPMRKHIAEFAGASQFGNLPPAERAIAPILQPARAIMIWLAQSARFDEVRQVTHGGHKAVSERTHVPDLRALRGFVHAERFTKIHGNRLFAKDMLACRDGRVCDWRVS